MSSPPISAHLRPFAEAGFRFLKLAERAPNFTQSLSGLLVAFCIAKLLMDDEEVTPSEVVRITELPKSTVTRLLGFYIEDGLLEEQEDALDRRRRVLRPGPNHRELVEGYVAMMDEIVERHWGQRLLRDIKQQSSKRRATIPFADHVTEDLQKLSGKPEKP